MSLLWEVDFIQSERRRRLARMQPLYLVMREWLRYAWQAWRGLPHRIRHIQPDWLWVARVVAGTMLAVALAIALGRG